MSLKPVSYLWTNNSTPGEGFLAHEVADVVPLAVAGIKDAVDAEGKIIPQTIDYSKLVVHLVSAIQDLKQQLDEVKQSIH